MVKVVRPLFSDSARGRIADIGSFRMSRHGPQFIAQAQPVDRRTPPQLTLRGCFAQAKAAHAALPEDNRPRWPAFWRQWLQDHPECTP
jgi:hypothetical protein